MKPSEQDLQSSKNPPQDKYANLNSSLEEEKFPDQSPRSNIRSNMSMDSQEDDQFYNIGQERNPHSHFYINENFKKYSNLYAIDGIASLAAEPPPYQKTYQDHMDVSNLVDLFGTNKSYNLDKMFESPSPTRFDFNNQVPMMVNQNQSHKNSVQILGDEFFSLPGQESNGSLNLAKLFEDPEEKLKSIQQRIQISQQRKRMRLNSGSSNQSKKRPSPLKFQNKSENMSNQDLLKAFDQKLSIQQAPDYEQINQMLSSQDIEMRMKLSLDKAKKNIRMEDPNRILTRLAFDFMSELISGFPKMRKYNLKIQKMLTNSQHSN